MQELMQALGVGQIAHSLYYIYNFCDPRPEPTTTAAQRVKQSINAIGMRSVTIIKRLAVSAVVSVFLWALYELATRFKSDGIDMTALWSQLKTSSYE
jgi:hypothetical protein